MPTSTFDCKIIITDEESIKKLLELITDDAPKKSFSRHPYTETERQRSEKLLKLCIARSKA